jgi:hypothetical protein
MNKNMNRMNLKPKVDGSRFQLLGQSAARVKKRSRPLMRKWPTVLRRSQRHDSMLVLNMAMFNFSDGWNRMFNPMKVHQNGIP